MVDLDRRAFTRLAAVTGLLATPTAAAAQYDDDDGGQDDGSGDDDGTGGSGTGDDSPGDDGQGDDDNGDDRDDDDFPGLVTVERDTDFETTVGAVESAIEERGLLTVATVDHAENAASVDEELPPTTLFIFGNPAVGTQLMQASRSVAIDLPQKMLVWEDDGSVYVTYNDPDYLAERHDVDDLDDLLDRVADLLESIATAGG